MCEIVKWLNARSIELYIKHDFVWSKALFDAAEKIKNLEGRLAYARKKFDEHLVDCQKKKPDDSVEIARLRTALYEIRQVSTCDIAYRMAADALDGKKVTYEKSK